MSVDEALKRMKVLPYEEMDDILLDHHRYLRKGFPEVIYGRGKGRDQIKRAVTGLMKQCVPVLVTRVGADMASELIQDLPELTYDRLARALYYQPEKRSATRPASRGTVLIMTAGTSDLPVAREARLSLDLMDITCRELIDVGVAGLHRLFGHLELMEEAGVVICIAGMEGALPSIVAGLTGRPVIAVPTSTGYGSNLQGLVPLLAMLNSCAPGIGVVNIDNGFGAAALAAAIIRSTQTDI